MIGRLSISINEPRITDSVCTPHNGTVYKDGFDGKPRVNRRIEADTSCDELMIDPET